MWRLIKTIAKSAWEPVVATLCFLLLFGIHTTIVRSSLTVAGLSNDRPAILGVISSSCGSLLAANRAVWALWQDPVPEDSAEMDCRDSGEVLVAAPLGSRVQLYVNRNLEGELPAKGRIVAFTGVRLRPGTNLLTASASDARAWLPYGTEYPPAAYDAAAAPNLDQPLAWVAGASPLYLELAVEGRPDGTHNALLGSWPLADTPGRRAFVLAGSRDRPGPEGQTPGGNAWSNYAGLIESSGLAVLDLAVPPEFAEAAEPRLTRALLIRRDPLKVLEIDARACLPDSLPLVETAQNGTLSGAEFVARVFSVQAGVSAVAETVPFDLAGVVTVKPGQSGACTELSTELRVANGTFLTMGFSRASFPQLPGDSLTIDGMQSETITFGRAPDERNGPLRIWRGRADPSGIVSVYSNLDVPKEKRATPEPAPAGRFFLSELHQLHQALPRALLDFLQKLTPIVPLGILLWAMYTHGANAVPSNEMHRASAGLIALLVFVTAYALQLPLTQLVQDLPGSSAVQGLRFGAQAGQDAQTPLALVAVILMIPMLRSTLSQDEATRWRWARIPAAAATLLLLGLGAVILTSNPVGLMAGLFSDPSDRVSENAAITFVAALAGLWCLLGLALFWLSIYWILRSLVGRGSVWRAALLTAVVIFILPLAVQALDLLSLAAALSSVNGSGFQGALAFVGVQSITRYAPALLALVLIGYMLVGFREIMMTILASHRAKALKAWTPWWVLALTSLAIYLSIRQPASVGGREVEGAVLQVLDVFQTYAAVFGLAVVFAIVDSYDLHRAASPSPFALPEGIVLICGAAFAGYLSIWGDNPVSVLLLAMLGWFLFRKAMITAPEPSLQRPDGPVAERLIRFREEAQLLDGRRKSAERDYMERKINDTDLGAEMKRLDELGAASGATLGMTPEQAKFWTLNFGPGASPLRNAMIGAAGGVVAAILMQILVVLTRAPEKAELPVWLSLAGTMVGDFRHSIVSGEGSVSLVLSLVSAVLNAFAFWVILGFIFGMVFHRLRGTDGFTKALTFSAGMAVPFLVSQVLAGPGEGIGLYRLLGLVPVIVVLLVLGVVVFDGFSLRRQDVSPRALPDIYGVNTSIGYASLVGAIASIQPIFQLAGRLFKKPSGK